MVDKKFQWRPSEDVRTHTCRICKSDFQTNRAADCHCGDECRAEAKRRHAKAANERIKLARKQREEEKIKKKLHQEITSQVERERIERVDQVERASTSAVVRSEKTVSIKTTANPKRNKSTKDYIGIQKPTSKHAKRPCLKCQKLFDSEWIGNRVCTKCDSQNVSLGGRETKFTPERRGIRFGNY